MKIKKISKEEFETLLKTRENFLVKTPDFLSEDMLKEYCKQNNLKFKRIM